MLLKLLCILLVGAVQSISTLFNKEISFPSITFPLGFNLQHITNITINDNTNTTTKLISCDCGPYPSGQGCSAIQGGCGCAGKYYCNVGGSCKRVPGGKCPDTPPPTPTPSTTFLRMQTWPKRYDCSRDLSTGSDIGAIRANVCFQINSTSSRKVYCSHPTFCYLYMFDFPDCDANGNQPYSTTFIKTTGTCASVYNINKKTGSLGPLKYGVFTQVDEAGATANLPTPYNGIWDGSVCKGQAFAFHSSATCKSIDDDSFSEQCMNGIPESCHWLNSKGKCPANSGTCSPLPGSGQCQANAGKATKYFC